ncbi:hypothetical protein FRB91_010627 [Serendipita sp. 411]|nr:hypothetical protein FRB91_010627 [Serendipita sp. 411]
MTSAVIYGTLKVPAKPSVASTRSLQWTPDGQLIVLGETTIYLLTPEIGINLDYNAANKAHETTNIPWATTAIPLQATGFQWPELSSEWTTICLGSVDFSWSAVTFSPTNYSPIGSCVLATLSSNLEVHLWAPKEDPYRGEWVQVQNVTGDLRTKIRETEGLPSEQQVLRAQIQTLAWSRQPPERRGTDASILAMGNRAGEILFFCMKDGRVSLVESIQVSTSWITHLAWANWQEGDQAVAAVLACGMSQGRIALVEVRQTRGPSTIAVRILECSPYVDDYRGITALEWIETEDGLPILVHCKPGLVSVWRDNAGSGWSGLYIFQLRLIQTSKSSTKFAPASGIVYLPQQNSLVISLIDGSYNVVHLDESGPMLSDDDDTSPCNSNDMSKASRAVFLVAEEKETPKPKDGSEPSKLYRNHVARTTGSLAVDSGGVLIWLHQRLFPETFDFIPDSQIRCLLMVAPLISSMEYDYYALQEIQQGLSRDCNFFYQAPISVLRGAFVNLKRRLFLERNVDAILSVLQPDTNTKVNSVKIVQPKGQEDMDKWRGIALDAAASTLSGDSLLCKEKLKFNLAYFCKSQLPKDKRFHDLSSKLQGNIEVIRLGLIVDLILQLPSHIIEDSPSVHRIAQRAKAILPTLHDKVEQLLGMIEDTTSSETCPACNQDIVFGDPLLAKCEFGHYWGRCSVTFGILATPNVKNCIGCGRKTLEYFRKEKEKTLSTDWIECFMLQATEGCPCCGNKCIKII